jgi:hypothetical protein
MVGIKNLAFDARYEEEIVAPLDKCASWDPIMGDRKISSNEVPSLDGARHMKSLPIEGRARLLHFELRPAACFGLHLLELPSFGDLASSSVLVVNSIEADSSFMKDADGKPGISTGDVIVEVNGRRGSADDVRDVLQQAVISSGEKIVEMVVWTRPATFDVDVKQDQLLPDKLGLAVVIDKTKRGCLAVQSVRKQGLIATWNSHNPSLCVCTGDLITEVNGISRDSASMCKTISSIGKGDSLRFHIVTKAEADNLHHYSALPQATKRRLASPRSLRELEAVGSIAPAETDVAGRGTKLEFRPTMSPLRQCGVESGQMVPDAAMDKLSEVSTNSPLPGTLSPQISVSS